MKKVAWFVLFLLMGVSCLNEPDCFRQNINLVGISFRKMFDGKTDTVSIYQALADGYSGILPDTFNATSPISLPLNYLKDETTLIIKGLDRTYTLLLGHKSKTQFVSEDCGQRFIVSDLAILSGKEDFDSIRLVSNTPSNPANVNIEIYRCPRNNIMRLSFRQLLMDNITAGRLDSRNIESVTADYQATPLYENIATSSLLLPLDYGASSATFDFKLDDDALRNISIDYRVQNKEILTKCGVQNLISDIKLTVDGNNLPAGETVIVANDSIHDPPYTNITVVRCPTTNTIRLLFRQLRESSNISDTIQLETLKADFLTTPIYSDTAVTRVELPLNAAADEVTYTFTHKDGKLNTLQLAYVRTPKTFHAVCGPQTVFRAISVVSHDFVTAPTVKDPKAKFPTVDNIEVIQ